MNKKQKGQIASLDFIMSLILLTLALGLVFRFTEINDLYLKGRELDLRLEKMGATAAEILLHSQQTACSVKSKADSSFLFIVPYCVDKKKLSEIQANNSMLNVFGIRTGYNIYLKIDEGESIITEYGNLASPAPSDPSALERLYSEERTGYVLDDSSGFDKAKLEDCLQGNNCDFKKAVITINVWK